jgi:hypothetical protein
MTVRELAQWWGDKWVLANDYQPQFAYWVGEFLEYWNDIFADRTGG